MITVKSREEFLIEVKQFLPTYQLWYAEIGIYRGDFSQKILEVLKPYLFYLIDPFVSGGKQYGKELNSLQTAYSDFRDYDFVLSRFWRNGSVVIEKEFSFNVIRKFGDKTFHFIYHDASHLYEDLKLDLSMWVHKLNEAGLMCGHDYGNELFPGVKQAVNEFCAEHNFEMIIFNENGGDYALRAIQ